eukprot:CAMPEP_0197585028 /NCGR_PEP_ID=MMETSP1326-20131121/7459_1 /TAXON_ID=1155430 /ORGANISM="Genus nov. species nov., Strain RCC2288" /LENGTH=119 /DNA_ID=CAMNT_0043149481 /DNA_START=278 /DNA_END=634 /DNA_ORIENTATION=+
MSLVYKQRNSAHRVAQIIPEDDDTSSPGSKKLPGKSGSSTGSARQKGIGRKSKSIVVERSAQRGYSSESFSASGGGHDVISDSMMTGINEFNIYAARAAHIGSMSKERLDIHAGSTALA